MATNTWYLDSKTYGGATTYAFWTRDFSALTNGSNYTNTGWNVGRSSVDTYAPLSNGNETPRTSFISTVPASSDFSGSSIITDTGGTFRNDQSVDQTVVHDRSISLVFPYNAVFNSGLWTLSLDIQAQTRAGGGSGRVIVFMYQGYFNNGSVIASAVPMYSNAGLTTNITSAGAQSSIATNVVTTTPITVTATWYCDRLEMGGDDYTTANLAGNGGYLMMMVYWQITTAIGGGGANNNCDAMIMHGTNASSTLVTPSFRKRVFATQ